MPLEPFLSEFVQVSFHFDPLSHAQRKAQKTKGLSADSYRPCLAVELQTLPGLSSPS